VEPIARAEVGTITAEEVWRGLVDGLPNGEPVEGDRGLDNTHTWGRTYWGGAMFCFVADVEIRKRTQNRASLETALRGVLDGLGSGETRATLDDFLRAGDRAIGVPVLEELHARLGGKAETIDLAKVWSDLGVRDANGKIAYDDAAPSAAIRRAMTARK
jgi:mannose-1-phosphate guanylyltransferase